MSSYALERQRREQRKAILRQTGTSDARLGAQSITPQAEAHLMSLPVYPLPTTWDQNADGSFKTTPGVDT